jgi:phage terminase large subunit-like protein
MIATARTNLDSSTGRAAHKGRKSLVDICRTEIPNYDAWATAGDCVFDEKAARTAIAFFPECLHHTKGSPTSKRGTPFKLDTWEQAVIGNTFGWKKPDGSRRYREVFIFIPRKNGKSTLAAGLDLFLLFCDGETGAEVYCIAADKGQANIVFRIARDMVNLEPELKSRCKVYKDSIVIEWLGSVFKSVTADANTKYGFNAHGACVDELHAIKDREVVDAWTTSTAARKQPLIVYLTTAGVETDTICYEKYQYAKQVLDGTIPDDEFLPVIYEADREDDWKDEKVWAKANPGLGKSVRADYLRGEVKKAIQQPSREGVFRRLHLNQWVAADVKWISSYDWQNCKQNYLEADLEGQRCYAGLDLSSTKAITSFDLVFPLEGDDMRILSYNFLPSGQLQQHIKLDKVPYDLWAKQGWLVLTPGDAVDYAMVKAKIIELAGRFNIQKLGVDRWQAESIMQDLAKSGMKVEPYGQGFKDMTVPSKEFERRIIARKIHHNGNPVLSWAVDNAVVKTDEASNIKPDKKKATRRIDPVVGTIMALGCYCKSSGGSVYESRGVLTI